LTTLTWLSGLTRKINLLTNVVVVPNRNIVVLARESTTLDQVSGGRLIYGLGLGANSDEFESLHPRQKCVEQGGLLDETLEALRILLTERSATFIGKHIEFADVELYPKATLADLPIYLASDTPDGCRRAARWGHGWISFVPGPGGLKRMATQVASQARELNHATPTLAPMVGISIADTSAAADRNWGDTQFSKLVLRARPDASVEEHRARNLVGGPDAVRARSAEYAAAGADHLTLVFTGNTLDQISYQLTLFIKEVGTAA
jgi:alkanesulfonate monooxygenase SsuD/methylene tetrahydromethanopterin reductase-like flavin-dependent oxidoreductase (luciferase family)